MKRAGVSSWWDNTISLKMPGTGLEICRLWALRCSFALNYPEKKRRKIGNKAGCGRAPFQGRKDHQETDLQQNSLEIDGKKVKLIPETK
jgi:hypothetical protein